MRKYFVITFLALMASGPSFASRCNMPSAKSEFATSDNVVAAEVREVSITPAGDRPGTFQQVIQWRVHESWKGNLANGRDFTTVNSINCKTCTNYKLKSGQLMVLYLSGGKPFQLAWCSHSNRLEYSLKDIPLLYKLSGVKHGS